MPPLRYTPLDCNARMGERKTPMAGGFAEKASKGWTKVLRTVNGQEKTFEMTLDSLAYPSDIIVVPQGFFWSGNVSQRVFLQT